MIGFHFNTNTTKGFTLIEVLITMALFTMTVLMAVTLLVVYIQQQRRTIIQEQLQNDARAVMEKIAADIREGTIDYSYYSDPIIFANKKLLFSSLDGQDHGGPNEYLVLRDAFNTQIMYRITTTPSQVLQRCTPATVTPNSCLDSDWQAISPSTMKVENFIFYIAPSENAFDLQSPTICGTAGTATEPPSPFPDNCSRWGTACEGIDENGLPSGECALRRGVDTSAYCYCAPKSFGSILPLQPRVTFSIAASRTVGNKTVSETFQTTISSRVFQNADRINKYVP